jgi:hypothetical protein
MGAARSNHGQQGGLLRTCDTEDDAVQCSAVQCNGRSSAAQRKGSEGIRCRGGRRSPVPGFGFEGGDLLRW